MATLSDLKEVKEANREFHMRELSTVKAALDAGLVSQADYDAMKRKFLALQATLQQRKAEADLQAFALESIVKHGSSIMSEEQKVDLVRDYARMSGLNRGAEKDEPSSKRQRIQVKKRDASPSQIAAPPRTPPDPVVAKPSLSQGTLLFHKIEDYPIWPIRVMSWDPWDKTDPAQCRVPDGSHCTTNYYEYPDKKKKKEVLILYLGKDADFVSENKSSNRFLSWNELKDDLKAWVDGSLDDKGLKEKHKTKIAGEDYFQGLKSNSKLYKIALEDAFEYSEKRGDLEWLWNEDHMYKKYGYYANWEESKRAEFEARRRAQGGSKATLKAMPEEKRKLAQMKEEEEAKRLSQLSEAQLKAHIESKRSKITADWLLTFVGSLEEGEKGKRKFLMNALAKCKGYEYLAHGFRKETCRHAAKKGHLDVVKWLRSQNPPYPWDGLTCSDAASKGHLAVVKCLRSLDPPCPWGEWACPNAARNGHLDVLKWLRSQDPPCPWGVETCRAAARNGHLDVLKWLRSQDPPCPWDKWVCHYAAVNGHLDVLKWVRSQDPPCPWNEWACYYAAEKGHLDVLKWLRSQNPPCPWNEGTCFYAARNGHLDVLKWLIDNGCPYNVNAYGCKSAYEKLGLA